MGRFQDKLSRYWQGALHGLRHFKPRYVLKLLEADRHTIRRTLYDFLIIVDLHDSTIGRSIVMTGGYENNVTLALRRLMTPTTRFLDIGANLGWFSLLAAQTCPQGHVYSFEPDPRVFQLFTANINLNGFNDRITAYNLAASDQDGAIILTDLGNASNYGARFTTYDRAALKQYEHGPNPVYTTIQGGQIDTLLADAPIDLIKIDIEGFEPVAMRGMTRLLERCQPVIISEFAPSNLQALSQTSAETYLDFFFARGYSASVIAPTGDLIACGREASRVMTYFHANGGHHLDIVFQPG